MTDFSKMRILLVEDESAIAILLEDMLVEIGCTVVASAARIEEARALLDAEVFDAAILDVNVGGERSYSLCDLLCARNIPFMFSTGYGPEGFPPQYKNVRILRKPFHIGDLRAELSHLFG